MRFILFVLSLFFAFTVRSQCTVQGTFTRDTGSRPYTTKDVAGPYKIELKENGEYVSTYLNPANGGAPETQYAYTGKYLIRKNKVILERIHFPSGENIFKIILILDADKCILQLKDDASISYKK